MLQSIFPHILPNAQKSELYELPTVYYCLIHAMIVEYSNAVPDPFPDTIMIPDIEVEIEYVDVQGLRYKNKASIHTEAGWAFLGGCSLVVTIQD